MSGPRPQVIGHRGAPGYRPEHTLASYRLAIALGADAVEPDVVMTRDGVPVLRHETELGGTTDIARHGELARRRTTRQMDGRAVTGWFCEDFTLAELKTLRAVERLPGRRPASSRWDGRFEIATLHELLVLLEDEAVRLDRAIGLNIELKSAAYLRSVDLSVEHAVLETLRGHGLERPGSGVLLQSFEPDCLQRLRARTELPLVQLVDDPRSPLLGPSGLAETATYARALGVAAELLLDRPGLVAPAHRAGLEVLAFTVRHDAPGGPQAEAGRVRSLVDAGVDGLFSDQPDQTLAVLAGAAPVLVPVPVPVPASTSVSLGTIRQATR